MTPAQDNQIEASLCELFPSTVLEAQARTIGVVQRARKVKMVALFWTLVLGFGIGKGRTIADLRRRYIGATGQRICRSAFYDRFTPKLVRFLQDAVAKAIQNVSANTPSLKGALSAFSDLILIDATVIRLHDLLQKVYTACRTNHTKAAAKLHLIFSVQGTSEQRVKFTAQRAHESRVLRLGNWVKGRLLLFDLGFFKYALFDRIAHYGGYFISRLKSDCNPILVALNEPYSGRIATQIGEKLQDALYRSRRKFLDLEVNVRFPKRAYKGKRKQVTKRFRVIGHYDSTSKSYHLYITNIRPEQLSAAQIVQTYRARWFIELIFKQLKSYYHLEDLPSAKQPVVEALLYTAILTMFVSRTIQRLLEEDAEGQENGEYPDTVFPLLRLAAVLSAWHDRLLDAVLIEAGIQLKPLTLFDLIRKEAADPNRSRSLLLQQMSDLKTP